LGVPRRRCFSRQTGEWVVIGSTFCCDQCEIYHYAIFSYYGIKITLFRLLELHLPDNTRSLLHWRKGVFDKEAIAGHICYPTHLKMLNQGSLEYCPLFGSAETDPSEGFSRATIQGMRIISFPLVKGGLQYSSLWRL
jgi:hypothetical protein